MDGVECVLPGLPCLVRLWLSVPLWVVVGKLFVEEEVGRGKWRKPVVDDCSAGTLVFLMRFLHRHDKLGDAGVAGPVAREFADEGDSVGYSEAPNFFREMGKEHEW